MNISIVDHRQLIGHSLKYLLVNSPKVENVWLFSNSKEFLSGKFRDDQPDILISDMILPDLNAFDLLAAARVVLPKIKSIILTSQIDPDTIKEAFRRGIMGYLTCTSSEGEFLQAIEMVQNGKRYVTRAVEDKLLETLFDTPKVDYRLSAREMEVLGKICSGTSRQQIADELGLSIHTIQEFIRNLRKKMNVTRTADLILVAIKRGLYTS